ncbi:hypothetical protein BurJ1DRAFT_2595 [Burkholderiales bacterium JOSHI_001]|nr:hypothetical protein BurJ1DRAFT_2595 [Burkholderiales bacterium JOSHI_001]
MTPATMAAGSHALHQRAAVARLLLARAGDAATALDWESLDRAPAWLALPADELAALQRRLGAVHCAGTLRRWIDSARLGAARQVLGEPFFQALLASDPVADPADPPAIHTAAQVEPLLRHVGAAVLVSALPPGRLRRVVEAALKPGVALTLAQDAADTTLTRVQALLAQMSAAPSATARSEVLA